MVVLFVVQALRWVAFSTLYLLFSLFSGTITLMNGLYSYFNGEPAKGKQAPGKFDAAQEGIATPITASETPLEQKAVQGYLDLFRDGGVPPVDFSRMSVQEYFAGSAAELGDLVTSKAGFFEVVHVNEAGQVQPN